MMKTPLPPIFWTSLVLSSGFAQQQGQVTPLFVEEEPQLQTTYPLVLTPPSLSGVQSFGAYMVGMGAPNAEMNQRFGASGLPVVEDSYQRANRNFVELQRNHSMKHNADLKKKLDADINLGLVSFGALMMLIGEK